MFSEIRLGDAFGQQKFQWNLDPTPKSQNSQLLQTITNKPVPTTATSYSYSDLPCVAKCLKYNKIDAIIFKRRAPQSVSVWGCVCVRVCVCVCVCVCVWVWVCMCVCVWEGEREREWQLAEIDATSTAKKTEKIESPPFPRMQTLT